MSWWTGQLIVDNPGLIAANADLLKRAPDLLRQVVNQRVNRVAQKGLARLRKEPGRVVYPIQWASEKQRRAFFASNGFGRGIPTRRSHALVNAWRLVVTYTPDQITEVSYENATPYRPFVTGNRQQPFHKITGWGDEAETFLDTGIELADEVETGMLQVFYLVEG